ncbi:MAG: GNAT family N-acetyltransferase [Pseudomonadota bacterium]
MTLGAHPVRSEACPPLEAIIRPARLDEADTLRAILVAAVEGGTAGAYSAAQRRAWIAAVPTHRAWRARLGRLETWVAQSQDRLVGFMSLNTPLAEVDLAYVSPDVMGRGVAQALYAAVERHARAAKIAHLATDASALAKPFFQRQGWQVIARQNVVAAGVAMHNYKMTKAL